MFSVGDYVFNQKSGNIGKVVGYGHQITDLGYVPTLKVLVAQAAHSAKRGFVEEDLYSAWTPWQKSGYA